jgi:hypothetical protein
MGTVVTGGTLAVTALMGVDAKAADGDIFGVLCAHPMPARQRSHPRARATVKMMAGVTGTV